jgi:hypothetical protein
MLILWRVGDRLLSRSTRGPDTTPVGRGDNLRGLVGYVPDISRPVGEGDKPPLIVKYA